FGGRLGRLVGDGRGGVQFGFALDVPDRGRGDGLLVGERGLDGGGVGVELVREAGQPGGEVGGVLAQPFGEAGGQAGQRIEGGGSSAALGGCEAEGGGEIGEGGETLGVGQRQRRALIEQGLDAGEKGFEVVEIDVFEAVGLVEL